MKPCPFCGSTQIYVTHTRYYDNDDTVCVFCNACKQYVVLEANEAEELNGRTKAAAVAAWNTRAERTCHDQFGGKAWCFKCDACGCTMPWKDSFNTRSIRTGLLNYCPSCGARVVV